MVIQHDKNYPKTIPVFNREHNLHKFGYVVARTDTKLSDVELNNLMHPPQYAPVTDKYASLQAYFPIVDREMRRRGMTIALQYKKYRELNPDGYLMTAFYTYYRQWKQKVYPSMHIEHKVGDRTYIDFAGETLPYVDVETGEIKKAQIFVAILGWSQYAYVEAVENQTIEEFIHGCANSFNHFGGVTLAVVPDNLKSAVFKADKYEPALNENFKAFADHYGISIFPTRARKPKDKAHVENMVKIAYQRIYAKLPNNVILTLEELNKAIKLLLKELNADPLTGKVYSRHAQWLLELPNLHPLPSSAYQMRNIKLVTVSKNGHVYLADDQHYYSVPYLLIGKKLKMHYTREQVELYDNYTLVATHKRLRSPHNYTTLAEHLPERHRSMTEWSAEYFLTKAKAIDPIVEQYMFKIFQRKEYVQQSYRSCQGILMLGKRFGKERLIKAVQRSTDIGYFNYKAIEDILKKNLDLVYDEDPNISPMPKHDNIRGGNYYQ